MKYTPLSFDVNLRSEGIIIDLDSLFAALARLQDRRDARGLRYALVTVLVFIVLLSNVRQSLAVEKKRMEMQADLLVHVRDRSSPADLEQAEDVLRVLGRLEQETGLPLPPMIEAWNKADLLSPERAEALEIAALGELIEYINTGDADALIQDIYLEGSLIGEKAQVKGQPTRMNIGNAATAHPRPIQRYTASALPRRWYSGGRWQPRQGQPGQPDVDRDPTGGGKDLFSLRPG